MPVAMKLAVISLVFCYHVAGQRGLGVNYAKDGIDYAKDGVDYAKDGSYGYVPPSLVPTLHSLEQKTEKTISVTCCDKKRAVSKGQCGNGIKCEGICEKETEHEHAIIILSNSTSKNWCDITSGSTGVLPQWSGSHGIFNIPLNFINWCTWSVTHSSQISTYPVCCLHPYVYNNVEGVARVCCAEFGLCF
eukprot:GFUD01110373.1.p1 GENE.GFUD01110373.1~~GFUD01110373.1.p1  ORF type:complete len:190 (+),score=22.99 GFUD01110373.1:40-609(+)